MLDPQKRVSFTSSPMRPVSGWMVWSLAQRVISALKYTSFTIVIFFVLFMLGLFLQPGDADLTNPQWYLDLFVDDSTPCAQRRTRLAPLLTRVAPGRPLGGDSRQTLCAPCCS